MPTSSRLAIVGPRLVPTHLNPPRPGSPICLIYPLWLKVASKAILVFLEGIRTCSKPREELFDPGWATLEFRLPTLAHMLYSLFDLKTPVFPHRSIANSTPLPLLNTEPLPMLLNTRNLTLMSVSTGLLINGETMLRGLQQAGTSTTRGPQQAGTLTTRGPGVGVYSELRACSRPLFHPIYFQ